MCLHRADMGTISVVLIILVTFNCLTCRSLVQTLEIHNKNNDDPLSRESRNTDQKSQNNMVKLSKFAIDQIPSNGNIQFPLMRSSRTVSHKPLRDLHSKHKHKVDPFLYSKKHKLDFLAVLLKPFGAILEGFMYEIEKVLNWWGVALKNLKEKMKEKKIPVVRNSDIEMMNQEYPTVRNKILELMYFIFEYVNFSRNADRKYPSKRISMDVKGSLNKIKNMASSFIMLLDEYQLTDSESNDKISKIQSFFDSIPADECAILDNGLVNGHADIDLNGMLKKNPYYNDEADILKSQTYMLQIMWKYINHLPVIFEMIFEIIGDLFTVMDWKSLPHGFNKPNASPPKLRRPPVHHQSCAKHDQYAYWPQVGFNDWYRGSKFPSNVRPSKISKSCPPKMILYGQHGKSFTDLKSSHRGSDIQFGPKTYFSDANVFNHNYEGEILYPICRPTHDSSNTILSLEISTVLSLLDTQQLGIGDIVILNLDGDIILVGRVDDNVNPIIFNIVCRTTSRHSSYTSRSSIWNLSHRDLSGNPRIYNDIIHHLTCL